MASLRIRLFAKGDLAFADSLRALVGWNQTPDDWMRFLNHQPDGCFVAELDGQPVGTATTTIYEDKVAWIGIDRKSTRLNSSHVSESRMPSSA